MKSEPNYKPNANSKTDFQKYITFIFLTWTIVLGLTLTWAIVRDIRNAEHSALEAARSQIEKDILYRRWNAGHGGVYVPVTESTPPNPNLTSVIERDIETPSGKQLTLMNPAYMTRQVYELAGSRGHLTSLNPLRKENRADTWESGALQAFEQGVQETSSVETLQGEQYLRLMRPMLTESGCLNCHADQGYEAGDIRGGISVAIPLAPYEQIAGRQRLRLATGFGVVWLIGCSIWGVGLRQMRIRNDERINIMRNLKESESRHRTILQTAMDGFWLVDVNGVLVDVNDSYCRMSGYTRGELLGMKIPDIDAMESPAVTGDRIASIRELGNERFKTQHRRKDGSIFDVEVNVQFQILEEERFVVFIRDISESRKAEKIIEAIQERTSRTTGEAFFRELVQCLGQHLEVQYSFIAKLRSDESSRILAVWDSGNFGENFNYEPAGAPCKEVVSGNTRIFQSKVQESFPEDELFVDLQVESYMGTPLQDAQGHTIGLLVIMDVNAMEDVDRKKHILEVFAARAGAELGRHEAEIALNISQEKYRIVYENMAQGVFYQMASGELIDANPAALAMFGLSEAELIHQPPENFQWDTIHEDGSTYAPEELPSVVALATGRSVLDETLGLFNPELQAFVWVNMNAIPQFREGDEKPFQVFVTMHNITQRRQVEENYQTLFREMLDGFAIHELICDDDGKPVDYRFLSINPAFERLTGLKAQDISGKTVLEIIPETEQHWIDTYGAVALTGDPIFFENYSEGLGKHFQVTAFRPAPMQFVTIFVDITDRKRAEEERLGLEKQLIQSQKLETVGTMVGGVSHELNNVLQSMFLYGGLIQDELPAESDLYANMQQLMDDGERAKDLVNQILTFSRKSEMQYSAQAIHKIVLNAIAFERASFPPNIKIEDEIDQQCGSILCDSTQIHQIVINLCNNAKDAMGSQGGTLSVTLTQTEAIIYENSAAVPVLELCFADDGRGMEEATLSRIFDPFFTTKSIGEGTGLGLSVVYGIIQMMKGKISATSILGEGSTFVIQLPLIEAGTLAASDENTEKYELALGSILLVDDETSILAAMQKALNRKGFMVDTAADGEQALALFSAQPEKYDWVVTDYSMPEMSGSDLTKRIRMIDSNIPIIFSTGNIDVDDQENLIAIGVSGFIQKPWSVGELLDTIRDI